MWYRESRNFKLENLDEYFEIQEDLVTGRGRYSDYFITGPDREFLQLLTNQDREDYILHTELDSLRLRIEVIANNEKIVEKEIGRAKALFDNITIERRRKMIVAK